MNITINNRQKIMEISDNFHSEFHYLKLEFFSRPHEIADLSKMKYIVDHNKTIGECRTIDKEGIIEIRGNEKVWQLEQEFQKFGLPVQVFRKMKDNWIETIQTDSWTLDDQNKAGEDSMQINSYINSQEEMGSLDLHNI